MSWSKFDEKLNIAAGYAWGALLALLIAVVFAYLLWLPIWKTFIVVYGTAWFTFIMRDI